MLIFYYLLSILTGAFLLSTRLASTAEPLSFIDSLFTATSAQCVTGLIVVDTGTRFTLFGQVVILVTDPNRRTRDHDIFYLPFRLS